jgi:MoxR-like ATPase
MDNHELQRIAAEMVAIKKEVAKVFVGSHHLTEMLLTTLVAGGHALLEGVPGVAKTTLVKAFSQTLACSFRRIQFTPDLLPSDVTGTYILDLRDNTFVLREGPIFANILLGDEINRAPAKTQSALLEAMQESQVTIEGQTRPLEAPFMVLATQNPIEHEGTYPLPEAQVDRFLIKLRMGYPDAEHERRMLQCHSQATQPIEPLLSPKRIVELQQIATNIRVDDELLDYIVALAAFTREHPRTYLGASPRASLMLLRAARAHALIQGRSYVLPDDIKELATLVFGHRILLAPEAELEGLAAELIIAEALTKVPYHPNR